MEPHIHMDNFFQTNLKPFITKWTYFSFLHQHDCPFRLTRFIFLFKNLYIFLNKMSYFRNKMRIFLKQNEMFLMISVETKNCIQIVHLIPIVCNFFLQLIFSYRYISLFLVISSYFSLFLFISRYFSLFLVISRWNALW